MFRAYVLVQVLFSFYPGHMNSWLTLSIVLVMWKQPLAMFSCSRMASQYLHPTLLFQCILIIIEPYYQRVLDNILELEKLKAENLEQFVASEVDAKAIRTSVIGDINITQYEATCREGKVFVSS